MAISKRYVLAGFGIVIFLVLLVSSVRFARGTTLLSNLENPKTKGPKDAPVHLVVYSDFQCPACRGALEPIEELRSKFSDVTQVEFRHYPLEQAHRWALTAASFAECAAEQGKFWEFHDRLFQEQATWSQSQDPISLFAGYAYALNLDRQKFEGCLGTPRTLGRIRQEHSSGARQGVQSTPTIFINGHLLVGSLQLKEKGRDIVLEELKKAGIEKEG